ncbi:ATP-dependent DNA helicase RecG [Acetobacteraceae bacterium]|nr:ATP-dependent DNA helicase RecG [Acetobacteraceae bacterium]
MPIAQPPKSFFPLLNKIETLKTITPKEAKLLEKAAGGEKIIDLLLSLPTKITQRDQLFKIRDLSSLAEGTLVTLEGKILSVRRPYGRSRSPTRFNFLDNTGKINISVFGKYYYSLLQSGNEVILSGKVHFFKNTVTISPLDHLVLASNKLHFPWVEATWASTSNLTSKSISKALKEALNFAKEIPEWHDKSLIKKKGYPTFYEALRTLHIPVEHLHNKERETAFQRARERLEADEIFAHQMCVFLAQFYAYRRKGKSLRGNGLLQQKLLKNFKHTPTADQTTAISEINKELAAPYPMQHLLQGDVGSGKTFVAFSAMLTAIEAGKQAAIMAPTEILAQQHFQSALKISPIKPTLITGKLTSENRKEALADIKSGKARFIVGTHALFQKEVLFQDLGLAVIDEQHRFGVDQRISFSNKSPGSNLLLMSATPIPRSVQLTRWGQMGVSRLFTKPSGRGIIKTTLHHTDHSLTEIKHSLKRALDADKRIYWVCPAVKESKHISAAEERYEDLKSFLGIETVGIVHGQQSKEEQEKSLTAFRNGKIKVLVSTTLIEVGVDIPEASIMVIEDAQRFGLSQLHQLRGRIGRGKEDSYCLLLYQETEGSNGLQRLSLLRSSLDGFKIAEEDYKQRGGGEITGTRQSGIPIFRLCQNSPSDLLITQSSQEAALVLQKDPKLISLRGDAIRGLMYLFEKTAPETILISG